MLTDLNWLDGGLYPPRVEQARIDKYKLNEELFLTRHSDALQEVFNELARRTNKTNKDVKTIFNYQQLLSKKTADFVAGEPPEINTEQKADELDKLLQHQRFNTRLYEAIIDVSRYGNAVLKIVGDRLSAVSPQYWYPVVDPTDLKTVTQHVIAYPITPDHDGEMTELYAEIHDIGRVEQRIYGYDERSQEIGALKSSHVEHTGLNDFAVQVLTNVTHSGSIYGIDDYAIINSIVAQIMWRLHCADTVLDKHSEPSLSGPSTALTWDERFNTYFLDLGNYFKRDTKDSPNVEYITWDGNLDSAYKEIELLLEQLYTLSEMGQAFMEGGGGGSAASGTALKLRMVSPRIKAQRLANINTASVKQIVTLLAQVNGITLDYDTLSIRWQDGLPDDEVEEVNLLTTATGGKAIMSQFSALKARGLSDEEVEIELEQMAVEQAANMPIMLSTIDRHADGELDG